MKLSLLVADGVHAGEVIAIEGVSLLVGRAPQCQVRPNSPAIGLRHCMLLVREERVFLRDLGSKTGTFLNDRQLRGEIELQDGDMVRIGPLTFIVQMESEEHAERPSVPKNAEPPAERSDDDDEDMVDLTRLDEPEEPSAADTQVVPGLEPYPTLPSLDDWQAIDDQDASSVQPAHKQPAHNGHTNGAATLTPRTGRVAPSRARLTRIIRSPRRPPT
jgi:pSer/pThr/pTyr-binding forkhead associated (FHA) protein